MSGERPSDRGRSVLSRSAILRNVTSGWAALLVNVGISFVLAPITVQSLGNVYYGLWTLLMQLTGYLWLFDFGVRESVVKYVSQYSATGERDRIVATVNTAVSMYGFVSAATLVFAVVLAGALPYVFNIPPESVATARLTTILVGGTVAQTFVFNVFVGVLMGLQKFYLMSRLNMVTVVVRGALVYALLKAGYGIVLLATVQFTVTLLSNLIVYRMCLAHLPFLQVRPARPAADEMRRLLNYGKYVLISNVGDKLVFATDSIIIGVFLPISALTYYAIGGSLIEQFRAFVTSMASVLNPLSSHLQARSETSTVAIVVGNGARAAVLIGVPFSVGFILLGETFIGIWMGPEYAHEAGRVLAVLAVGHLIGLPYYSISAVLYGLERHRVVAYSRIGEGIINLLLSVVLVTQLGLIGVAIGTVVPHVVVVAGILPVVLSRWVPIGLTDYYVNTYLRPLAASIPFAVTCWMIARHVRPSTLPQFFVITGASVIVYLIPAWFVALNSTERSILGQAVRRRLSRPRPVQELS